MNMNVWQVRVVQVLLIVALVMWLLGGCAPAPTEKPWTLWLHGNHGYNEQFDTMPSLADCRWVGYVQVQAWPGVIRYSCQKVNER